MVPGRALIIILSVAVAAVGAVAMSMRPDGTAARIAAVPEAAPAAGDSAETAEATGAAQEKGRSSVPRFVEPPPPVVSAPPSLPRRSRKNEEIARADLEVAKRHLEIRSKRVGAAREEVMVHARKAALKAVDLTDVERARIEEYYADFDAIRAEIRDSLPEKPSKERIERISSARHALDLKVEELLGRDRAREFDRAEVDAYNQRWSEIGQDPDNKGRPMKKWTFSLGSHKPGR